MEDPGRGVRGAATVGSMTRCCIDRLNSPGLPAMLLAIPYLYTASLLTVIIRDGGPGWLNLIVLIAIWSAFKMLWIGPVSLLLLARVRIHEHATRRTQRRQVQGVSSAPIMAGGAS